MLGVLLRRLGDPHPGDELGPTLATENGRIGAGDLWCKAGGLARAADAALPPGPVLVAADDAATLVVGALAALTSGRAFVPVDTRTGVDVLRRYIEVAGAVGLFAAHASPLWVAAEGLNFAALGIGDHPDSSPKIVPVPGGEPATIAFTSGSTGDPVPHVRTRDAFARRLHQSSELMLARGDRHGMFLGATSLATQRVLGALVQGVDVICLDARSTSAVEILDRFSVERITTLSLVPTYLRQLLAAASSDQVLPELRALHSGSEPLDWADIERVRARFSANVTVVHTYGATEVGGRIAELRVLPSDPLGTGRLSVGRPVPGVNVRLVDAHDHEVERGRPGRVVVTTATGHEVVLNDLGRFDQNGELELLGRVDAMTKIGGIRVEIGLIESRARAVAGVIDASCTVHETGSASLRSGDSHTVHLHVAITEGADGVVMVRAVENAIRGLEHVRGVETRIHLHRGSLPQLTNGKRDSLRLSGLGREHC